MKMRPALLAAISSIALSGCQLGTIATASRVSDGSTQDASRYMMQARQPLPAARTSSVQINDGVWTSGSARRSDHGEPLPRLWERDNSFVLKRATLMQLFEIGTEITNVTRIPVSFAPDVTDSQSMPTAAAAAPAGAPPAPARAGGAPDISAMLGSMGLAPTSGGAGTPFAAGNTAGAQGAYIRPLTGTRTAMKVDFEGRLSQFLNQVSAQFNVSWEYTGGEIRVFRSVTRTYTVHALPSTIDLKSTLTADSTSSGGSGTTTGGAASGSNQKVNSAVTVEIWKDISGAVNGIVGAYGHVSTAVSTGTITVTAPPMIISRVQAYLDGQNERLNKQVAVSVQVLNVSLTDDDNYALDMNAVFSKAGQYGLSLASPVSAAIPAAAGNFGFTVLSQKPVLGGTLNNSSAIIQALSERGRVTVRTTASVTTLNGVPAPLQVANMRGYVQNVAVTDGTTGLSGTSTTRTQLTTSTVTTGFSLSLLPRVDSEGNGLLLQFGINISELNGANNGFDNFTTPDGTEQVQLPNINSRNFVQQAFIPNGSTLVLAGFEQTTNSGQQSGVGHPSFMGLGGSQVGRADREIVVILMSPVVLSAEAPLITTD